MVGCIVHSLFLTEILWYICENKTICFSKKCNGSKAAIPAWVKYFSFSVSAYFKPLQEVFRLKQFEKTWIQSLKLIGGKFKGEKKLWFHTLYTNTQKKTCGLKPRDQKVVTKPKGLIETRGTWHNFQYRSTIKCPSEYAKLRETKHVSEA